VRRIEALTGEAARRWLIEQAGVAKALADQFKAPVSEVLARVEALEAQRRKLDKELGEAKRQLAMGGQGAGGKADFAQGGAPDDSKANEGLAAVKAALAV
jgi:alanyl-tRNA synthetase